MNRLSLPLLRWLSGAVAAAFLMQAVHGSDGIAFGLAILFGSKAIFNWGCCSTGSCALPYRAPGRPSMSDTAGLRTNQS